MTAAVENRFVFTQLDELEPAPRIAREEPTMDGSGSTSVAPSASPHSVCRRSARRAASTSSASTMRPCSARRGRRSSTSSSRVQQGSRSTVRSSRRPPAPWSRFSRPRGGRRRLRRRTRRNPRRRRHLGQSVRARSRGSRGGFRRLQRGRLRDGAGQAARRRRKAAGQCRGALQRRVLRGTSGTC